MRSDAEQAKVPAACRVGLIAAGISIGLWTTEQLTDRMIFELLAIPFKLALLAALPFFVSELSQLLYGRPKLALILRLTLIAVTLVALAAYLPWRNVTPACGRTSHRAASVRTTCSWVA